MPRHPLVQRIGSVLSTPHRYLLLDSVLSLLVNVAVIINHFCACVRVCVCLCACLCVYVGFHHRLPSLGNFGLLNAFPPGLPGYEGLRPPTVEIITDFKHVHPLTVAAVIGARSLDDVACVTDTVLEPTPGTKVKYLGRQLEVTPDGKTVVLAGTTTLAGSCCTLLDAFKNLVNTLGVSECTEHFVMYSQSLNPTLHWCCHDSNGNAIISKFCSFLRLILS